MTSLSSASLQNLMLVFYLEQANISYPLITPTEALLGLAAGVSSSEEAPAVTITIAVYLSTLTQIPQNRSNHLLKKLEGQIGNSLFWLYEGIKVHVSTSD